MGKHKPLLLHMNFPVVNIFHSQSDKLFMGVKTIQWVTQNLMTALG